MMKKIALVLFFLLNFQAFAIQLNELTEPKPFSGRLSNTDKVESNKNYSKKSIGEKKAEILPRQEINDNKIEEVKASTSYADLSLKRLADDISYEIDEDSIKINSDLAILWQAAMARSETMKYTIYKLSNPDEDKPDDSRIKKILKPIANFSSIAGASVAGDPYVATTALIGGGLVNAFMKDDKEVNYRFSKVSDADMVLLVRKIDDLQKRLLALYVDYKTKKQLVDLTYDNFIKREKIYKASQNRPKGEILIADMAYRNSKANYEKAKDDYYTSRAILENLVGQEAIKTIEE